MPALAPVDREEEAAALVEGEVEEDVVLPGSADDVIEALVVEADNAVVELAGTEVDVVLEAVVVAEVSLER